MLEGILLVDKPAGWTSFDVVNIIRKTIAGHLNVKPKNVKIGHSGTLDPFATGLLIILVGKNYTKRMNQLLKLDKSYQAEIILGKTSSTGDPEGDIIVKSTNQPTSTDVAKALDSFKGEIRQIPPAYSAIKINGIRSYKLARQGVSIEMPSRLVKINSINLLDYAYPKIKILTEVSSGTYVRSLVQDIGEKLGVGAYTNSLIRTKIGSYNLANALPINRDVGITDLVNNLITID